MATFTKQILRQQNSISKQRKGAPSRVPTKKIKKSSLSFKKCTLSNVSLLFSLSLDIVLSVSNSGNLPAINMSGKNNITLFTISVYDSSLRDLLISSVSDTTSFLQIVDQNKDKIDISSMGCKKKITDSTVIKNPSRAATTTRTPSATFLYPYRVKFDPKSFKDRSSPADLTIFCYIMRETAGSGGDILVDNIIYQNLIVGNALIASPNIIDLRTKKYDEYLDFSIINQVVPGSEAYFSDQFYSYDPNQFLKFIFFWDKLQFLKENSIFGNILNNTSIEASRQKMISDSLISDIKIIRQRVKKGINGFSKFSLNENPEIIVTSYESEADGLLPAEKIDNVTKKLTAKISSLPGVKSRGEYLSFVVNDYYPQRAKYGMYKYSIEIRLQDGMLKFLLDSLETLRKIDKQYREFLNIFSGNLSPSTLESSANVRIMLNILFSIRKYSPPNMESITREILLLLNSRESVLQLITFNENLMLKIINALGARGVATNLSARSKTTSKTTSNLFFLENRYEFSEIIDLADLKDIKYDYFNLEDGLSFGAAGFSLDQIENRFFSEFQRIISYDGKKEQINFGDLSEQLYSDNVVSDKQTDLKDGLFNLGQTYYSYLSPAKIGEKSTKALSVGQLKPAPYNIKEIETPQIDNEELSISYFLHKNGVSVENGSNLARKTAIQTFNATDIVDVKVSDIFGKADKINDENLSNTETLQGSCTDSQSFKTSIQQSVGIMNGINKFYNNFNMTRQSFDLSSPLNFLDQKRSAINDLKATTPAPPRAVSATTTTIPLAKSTATATTARTTTTTRTTLAIPVPNFENSLAEMPNQIRALFASRSEMVVNKWALTENDFFSNVNTTNMMKENYSNLISIEILTGFGEDIQGQQIPKLPIFKKLEVEDLNGMKAGELLFCRTYRLDDKSLGIGMKNTKNTENNTYYNKCFVISKNNVFLF
jgi:hypothetical protein